MGKVVELIEGKKTYLVAIAAAGMAAAQALGYEVPGWVETILMAAGLGSVRVAISKV